MINNLKVLAIIPARGGSKGLPDKNIVQLNGLPLIAYSILAAQKSRYVDLCLVSSDSPRILDVAQAYHSAVIRRPDELASDTASSESVVRHAISIYGDFELILLLQPTSPLRTARDIDSCIESLASSDATALISVYEPRHTPFKCFKLGEDGFVTGLVDNRTPFMRRQDLPMALMPNGAIYLIHQKNFLSTGSLITDKTIPYVMSIEASEDIDSPDDLKRVSLLLSQSGHSSTTEGL
ncbi:MAG: acylneuraminate cytidylyltransferase family protein [Luteolibacter sp.]|uniref:acylneuraminate cytidylyltransferase family protein n=1 Tax=Luteolibacter sp. TaxID=1962973 RepID=UPI003267E1F3